MKVLEMCVAYLLHLCTYLPILKIDNIHCILPISSTVPLQRKKTRLVCNNACTYVARVVKKTRLYRISRILEPFFFILEISRFSRIKKTREIRHH